MKQETNIIPCTCEQRQKGRTGVSKGILSDGLCGWAPFYGRLEKEDKLEFEPFFFRFIVSTNRAAYTKRLLNKSFFLGEFIGAEIQIFGLLLKTIIVSRLFAFFKSLLLTFNHVCLLLFVKKRLILSTVEFKHTFTVYLYTEPETLFVVRFIPSCWRQTSSTPVNDLK